MDSVILKQRSYAGGKLMVGVPLTVASILITFNSPILFPLVLIMVMIMMLNHAYIFNADGNHQLQFRLLDFGFIKFQKRFIRAEYVSLFNQAFKDNTGYGFLPSLSREAKYKEYVIRLFNKDSKKTVFVSSNKEDVLKLGNRLAVILNVELHNTLD